MIPTPLWIVLFFTSGVIFVYMLFFADSGERAIVQAVLMGTVTAVIVSMLLLLQFLDNPFHEGIGGLEPTAMERTLIILDEELQVAGNNATFLATPAASPADGALRRRHRPSGGCMRGPVPVTPGVSRAGRSRDHFGALQPCAPRSSSSSCSPC